MKIAKELKNYTEFEEIIHITQEQEKQLRIKATADYVEYIKLHDKEAYKKYLSYSTYLELCI